tara:strand:+ start:36 stop:440 length:405 start_codon:yes stop_codon:yes gene_type:complete
MPYTRVVVGRGRTAEEALLFARVNQICYDKCIDANNISIKTNFIEIPRKIRELNSASEKITAVYFAHAYHVYMENISKTGVKGEFTESEYKYYSILIKAMGREDFRKMMSIFEDKEPNSCIAICESPEYYKFMY